MGRQLRQLRLRHNMDQRELAARAGIGLNAVKHLESGRGATTRSLIRVLRAMGKADWIETLAPQVTISPLQILRAKHERQRVGRKRSPPGQSHV